MVKKTKKSQVRQKQKNGDIYILERETCYDPETKNTKVLSSKLIAKIPKGSTEPVCTRARKTRAGPERRPGGDKLMYTYNDLADAIKDNLEKEKLETYRRCLEKGLSIKDALEISGLEVEITMLINRKEECN